jgi:2'-5' RNA ligase
MSPPPLPASFRLFIALWPDDAVRASLAEYQARWEWPRGAARVPADRLHVTLHFLGQVEAAGVVALADGLDHADPGPSFSLRFTAPAVWQGGIAVLGTSQPPALVALHARVAALLGLLSLRTERRPYRPHVTLARKAAGATPAGDVPSIDWRVRDLALVASQPGRGYVVLSRHPA